jgi:hypothetical protein
MAVTAPRIRLGDLSVGFVHSLAEALRSAGQDPLPLLEHYGLDHARLAEPGGRLSIPRYMRLGHAALRQAADPALGLAMGQACRLPHLGLAGVTAAQAPTVREAARAFIRFEPLYACNYRGCSSFAEDAKGAWLRFYSISPYNAYNRFVVDAVLAGWLQHLTTVAGRPVRAEQVQIEFEAPAYAPRYSFLSETAVQFDASTNQMRLGQPSLGLRNPAHCPSTWQTLLALCERELAQLDRRLSLRDRITRLLGPMLSGGSEAACLDPAAQAGRGRHDLPRDVERYATGSGLELYSRHRPGVRGNRLFAGIRFGRGLPACLQALDRTDPGTVAPPRVRTQ